MKLKKVIIEEKAITRDQEKVLMVVHSLKIRFDTKSLGVALGRAEAEISFSCSVGVSLWLNLKDLMINVM